MRNNPERDEKIEQERAKAKVGEFYAKWKSDLTSRRRTQEELQNAFVALRDGIQEICSKHDVKPFEKFTLDLIDHKMAELLAVDITGANEIVQMIDGEVVPSSLQESFHTEEELRAIPWVGVWEDNEDFVGWLVDGKLLVAARESGNTVVGIMKNAKGINRLPSIDKFQTAISAVTGEPGSAPPEDPAPAETTDTADPAETSPHPREPGGCCPDSGQPDPSRN